MAHQRQGIPQSAQRLFPERSEQPFDVFLVCDNISQFDQKYVQDLTGYNCNLFQVAPEAAKDIKKTRKLRAIISVPELKEGNGFELLNSLREVVGKNTPLMVFSTAEAA
jgi:hypothetical protein